MNFDIFKEKKQTLMGSKIKIIERNRIIGGYSLSVRDNWVFKIKKVHLSENERNRYIEDFGEEQIITYDEFFDWYKKIKTEQTTSIQKK